MEQTDPGSVADRVLALVNEERGKLGLQRLVRSVDLCRAAQDHSRAMAENDFFDFDGPDGIGLGLRIKRSGYRGITGANLSHGYDTAEEAVAGWLVDDPGTRESLLTPAYRDLGIGVMNSRWTILLGEGSKASTAVTVSAQTSAQTSGQKTSSLPDPGQWTDQASNSKTGTAVTVSAQTSDQKTSSLPDLGQWTDPTSRSPEPEQRDEQAQRDNMRPERLLFRTQQSIDRVLDRLNEERAARSVPPLRPSTSLNEAAQQEAIELYRQSPQGTGITTKIDPVRLQNFLEKARYKGHFEPFLLVGPGTIEAAISAWISKYPQILSPDLWELGLGLEASRWLLLLGGKKRDLVSKLNDARQAAGQKPLVVSETLLRAATEYLNKWIESGPPSTPTGRTVVPIVLTGKSHDEVATRLLADEEHRNKILDPRVMQIGIAEQNGHFALLLGS